MIKMLTRREITEDRHTRRNIERIIQRNRRVYPIIWCASWIFTDKTSSKKEICLLLINKYKTHIPCEKIEFLFAAQTLLLIFTDCGEQIHNWRSRFSLISERRTGSRAKIYGFSSQHESFLQTIFRGRDRFRMDSTRK